MIFLFMNKYEFIPFFLLSITFLLFFFLLYYISLNLQGQCQTEVIKAESLFLFLILGEEQPEFHH